MSPRKLGDGTPSPPGPSNRDDDLKRHAAKLARLEGAITPTGSGSGGLPRFSARRIDYPLRPCEFAKWARYDSIPIERACFVLFGFEPPPLDVLRFEQNSWNPTREPTYKVPPEYSDALESLRVSIQRGGVSALGITEYPYETQHVTWPELVGWAKVKGFTVPTEFDTIVGNMNQVVADTRKAPVNDVNELSAASSPPVPHAAPVVPAGASDGGMPAPTESIEKRRTRLLDWFSEEEVTSPRGALQRVYERELKLKPTADRSKIGKDIKKAREALAEKNRSGGWAAQLVTADKRRR